MPRDGTNNQELDMDHDGVVTESEVKAFMKKTSTQSRLAMAAFGMLVLSFAWVLFADPDRVMRIAGLIETMWFLQITIIGAYMGFSALMSRK